MVSALTLKRELLRLAGARRHPACIDSKRVAAFYNVPEKLIWRELAKLADDQVIHLSGWDGRQMKPYSSWPNADSFVDSAPENCHFHVHLVGRE
jgi:hypothetical protein